MELLLLDINRIIVDILPMPDKRNLIRCCKYFNQLYPLMKMYETEFAELLNTTKFVSVKPIKFNQCELYILEYIYYDRENIPDKYLEHNKNLLTEYPLLYSNMSRNQINVCKKIYQKYERFITSIMNGFVSTGNLELVKWCREKGCDWYPGICIHAAYSGHIEILKWVRNNGCARKNMQLCCIFFRSCEKVCVHTLFPAPWDSDTIFLAAMYGQLETLKYAYENGCPMTSDIWGCAAIRGHLDILIYLRKNGCPYPWDENTCSAAAVGGHLEVLKWAYKNGCPWDEITCANAAYGGHLEVLKWARENGCPWNSLTCTQAKLNGHLEVLKWAQENGCPS